MKNRIVIILDRAVELSLVGFVASLPVSIAFTQTSLFVGWAAWLLKGLLERRWNGFKTPLDLGFALFLLSALLSTVFSLNPMESFFGLKKFYLLTAVYFVGFNVRTPARLLELTQLFLLITALTGVYGLVMFGLGYQPRLLAAQGMALTSGGIFMMAGLLSLAWLRYRSRSPEKLGRVRAWVSAALLVASLACTKTISSWGGFMAGFPMLIRSRWKRAAVYLLAALLLAGVFYAATTPRLSFKYFNVNKSISWNIRLSFWRMGWQLIKERPVLGTGLIDLGQLLQAKRVPADDWLWDNAPMAGHLHNNLVQITATRGFAGLAAFVFMWASVFLLAAGLMRSRSDLAAILAQGITAVLVGFHFNGLAEWNFSDSEVVTIVWFLTGLLLALYRLEREGGRDAEKC
jgi:O-antigen ligase